MKRFFTTSILFFGIALFNRVTYAVTLAPRNAGMELTTQFVNNSSYPDNQVYVAVLARNAAGVQCYLNASGAMLPVLGGQNVSMYSMTLNTFTALQFPPTMTAGRLWISYGAPLNMATFAGGGIAQPNLANPGDPNINTRFEFMEFTVGGGQIFCNSSQVDHFGIPYTMSLYDDAGGGSLNSTRGITQCYDDVVSQYQAFMNSIPGASIFNSLVGPIRIVAPQHGSFAAGQPNGNYFDAYIAANWGPYAATLAMPSTQDVFAATGSLATQPEINASLNRHVINTGDVNNPAAYYQAGPANYFSAFWHQINIANMAYGFPYDDFNNQSSLQVSNQPRALVITLSGCLSSPTPTPTRTPSATPSPSPSQTATLSRTGSPSQTRSPSATLTFSATATPSMTAMSSPSPTPSATGTLSQSFTPTGTPSASGTLSPTPSATGTPTQSSTPAITATLSRTGSPTPGASLTATEGIALHFSFDLEIFNSAGELVRVLVTGGRFATYPSDWEISDPLALPDDAKSALLYAAGTVFAFDGTNDQGQALASGSYYARLQIRDSFGKTTSYSGGLTVMRSGSSAKLCVSNSAGEIVRCLAIVYANGATPQGGGRLDSSSVAMGKGANITWDNASSHWDGNDAQGRPVKGGVYTLTLRIQDASGVKVKAWQLAVIEAPFEAIALKLSSNPWRSGILRVIGLPVGGQTDLYNAAGERVAAAMNGEFEYRGYASGIYVVRVWTGKQRTVIKLAIVR